MIKNAAAFLPHERSFHRIAAITLLIIMLTVTAGSAVVCAASSDEFQLTRTAPADGYSKVQAQNVMVKLYFNDDIDQSKKLNKDKFTFTNKKGKDVDFEIYYDSSQKNMVALLATNDLKVNKTYKVTVDSALVNNDGEQLGQSETITFMTKTSGGGLVYVLLMVAMVIVMMFFTVRDQRKKNMDEAVAEGKPAQAKQKNPYKLAKEKGISVEEATRLINKEKAKEQKKLDKQLNKQKRREEKIEKQLEEEFEEYQIFHVHTKRVVKRNTGSNNRSDSSKNKKKK